MKYRFSAKGENTLDTLVAYGKVSWLFHLISGSASYEHGELKWKLRLAWKKFDSSEEEQKETSEKPVVSEPLEKEPLEGKKMEVKNNPPEKDVKIAKASEKGTKIEKESGAEKTKVREERRSENVQTESKLKKIKYTFQKLCGTIKKAGEKKEFLTAFLTYEKHQRAFEAVKKELCHLLHVLKPKKLQANVTFGFSDPSWTGYMLAFLGSIYGLIGEYVQIQPDFEERKLEGNASAEGKIRVIYFAVPAWKLFWNKDVKITYKHIRKYIK
ncbi:MAG: DUF2953 domain-containing protein [Mediterraneibacter faecis]